MGAGYPNNPNPSKKNNQYFNPASIPSEEATTGAWGLLLVELVNQPKAKPPIIPRKILKDSGEPVVINMNIKNAPNINCDRNSGVKLNRLLLLAINELGG
ncbi:hypothetical protein DSM107007_46600 [Nostoc sp. PCC 7120 = FACHB-418]|nr:hypothetical protein DSM107007_46600 [Nostoc sp. PCC 7120 = FACHB-418]